MLPAYLEYWGLKEPPFSLAPNPRMFYLSDQHRECLMRLKYAIHSGKGGSLLISENAGNGKTTTLRLLVEELSEELPGELRVAFLDYPTMTPEQMVGEIARQLGVENVHGDNKVADLNSLRELLQKNHERGVHSLVIVDEGQMLSDRPDLLQEFRILLNFCSSGAFLLSFILSGQSALEPAVRAIPEFWQRLPVRFFLKDLHQADTSGLIHHRLQVCGAEYPIFTQTATEGIYRYSKGCPRIICAVADLALVVGHSSRARQVDFAEVSQACADMDHSGGAYHYFNFLEDEAGDTPASPAAPTGYRATERPADLPTPAPLAPVMPPAPPAAMPPAPALSTPPMPYPDGLAVPTAANSTPPAEGPAPTLFIDPIPNDFMPASAPEAAPAEETPAPQAVPPALEIPPPAQDDDVAALAAVGLDVSTPGQVIDRVVDAPVVPPAPQAPPTDSDTGKSNGSNGFISRAALPPSQAAPAERVCLACSAKNQADAQHCRKCSTPLQVSCGRCGAGQEPTHKACAYCGLPLHEWARVAELAFEAGLKRLNMHASARETEAIKFEQYRTLDGRVLYFCAAGGMVKKGARVRRSTGGKTGRFKPTGVIVGNRRLVLLGKQSVDIPLTQLGACNALHKTNPDGSEEHLLVVTYRNDTYEMQFPLREGRRAAFYRLLSVYLEQMRNPEGHSALSTA